MAKNTTKQGNRVRLRKETREWLATKTIPHARDIAMELENAGEDVHDLMAAIDELEALVKGVQRESRDLAVAKA